MSTEFVRITSPELVYGETNLLQSEMNLLTMLKQYQEYEFLRKEELYLKVELKKGIGELREHLNALAKMLPESNFEHEQARKEAMQRELANKIESAVQHAKSSEWKYWKEKEPKPQRIKEEKPKEEKPKKEKPVVEEEPLTPIDKELADIQRRLASLQ